MSRLEDLKAFYSLLDQLEKKIGGKKQLIIPNKPSALPQKGVYFFFEKGEERTDSGDGMRVVRVGTHATTATSRTNLWNRLKQHQGTIRGSRPGGGNHRGSIFRLHVGNAILKKGGLTLKSWGIGSQTRDAAIQLYSQFNTFPEDKKKQIKDEIKSKEFQIEKMVSNHIRRQMYYLWVKVDDNFTNRRIIEENSIGLLSNYGKKKYLDPPSKEWLGSFSTEKKIRQSGLWNKDYVDKNYSNDFIKKLKHFIDST